MKNLKLLIGIVLAIVLVTTQFAVAFAAPPADKAAAIAGTVSEVTLDTDPNTGVNTIIVTIVDPSGLGQTVRISEKTAAKLGLIDYDSADGNPVIVEHLPAFVEIDPTLVISDEEKRHPVGSALATFFSTIEGLDYNTIMNAHANGYGFGVIAQALWLVEKMGGTADDFVSLLDAKKNNNFENFPMADGTIPTTWDELKKAIADKNLGLIMSQKEKKDHSNDQSVAKNADGNSNKDKPKDKTNNGNGNGAGNGHGNGNGNKP